MSIEDIYLHYDIMGSEIVNLFTREQQLDTENKERVRKENKRIYRKNNSNK